MQPTELEKPRGPVGESVPRNDVAEKLTGAAIYADDIRFGNDLLYARIKRSPHPHALITSIDTSKAAALPGVKVIVTGDDFPATSASISKTVTFLPATGCALWGKRWPAWRPSAKKSRRRRSVLST